MRHTKWILGWLVAGLLAGCASTKSSVPIAPEAVAKGLRVVRELPVELPSKVSPVDNSQYLLVFAKSTTLSLLDTLIPLPISVLDPIAGAIDNAQAGKLQDRYAGVDPYRIALERFANSPLLSAREDALHLMPLVYMVEDSDGIFRATLVFRIENGAWLGRYMYHLPTTYSSVQVRTGSPEMMVSLRRDLEAGSDVLRRLIERDARGELAGQNRRVNYGSYYLVGSRIGGMVSASIIAFPDAEVLEESDEHIVLRSGGKPAGDAREGALAFGVHYFRKDQLHTLKLAAGK